jgi:hypothetical protein
MEFTKELESYRRELPNLLKWEGQYVDHFLVKQIEATEQPRILLHDLRPPCRI